jgi:ActR/RegA family two-component response regulator
MTAGSPGVLLIVDDDEALSQLLAWDFEDLEYRVWRARDCGQALAAARVIAFDFALIDFHLPDGDGRTLSHWLQRILPQVQMVMMSGDRPGASSGGPNGHETAFIEKPVPPARIHRMFAGRVRRSCQY